MGRIFRVAALASLWLVESALAGGTGPQRADWINRGTWNLGVTPSGDGSNSCSAEVDDPVAQDQGAVTDSGVCTPAGDEPRVNEASAGLNRMPEIDGDADQEASDANHVEPLNAPADGRLLMAGHANPEGALRVILLPVYSMNVGDKGSIRRLEILSGEFTTLVRRVSWGAPRKGMGFDPAPPAWMLVALGGAYLVWPRRGSVHVVRYPRPR